MTKKEFEEIRWGAGMYIKCNNIIFNVYSVDFANYSIGIVKKGESKLTWFHCRHCELLNNMFSTPVRDIEDIKD